MDRRDFLKKAAATTVVSSLATKLSHGAGGLISLPRAGPHRRKSVHDWARRISPRDGIGRTGKHPHHPHRARQRQSTSSTTAGTITAGVSEDRMGKALRDGYRQKAFLMTKIDGQTRRAADAAIGRISSPAANRPHRSLTVPRSHSRIRPSSNLWRGRQHGGCCSRPGSKARSATSGSPDIRIRTFT